MMRRISGSTRALIAADGLSAVNAIRRRGILGRGVVPQVVIKMRTTRAKIVTAATGMHKGIWKGMTVMGMVVVQTGLGQVSPHGKLEIPCQDCHETNSWAMKKDAAFRHEAMGFSLTGKHKTTGCVSCHTGLRFSNTSSSCTSCHTDVHRAELGVDCLSCHTTHSWVVPDMVQKHQQTRFPLTGRHRISPCQSCHSNASEHQYVGTPITCLGCHRTDYETATNPDHRVAQFSTDCSQCHQVTSLSWSGSFDHAVSGFPLTGAHRAAPCGSCHQSNTFKGLPTECVACHQADYQRTTNPNHVAVNFPMTCQTCHNTTAWQGAAFDHSGTRFPLTGAHVATPCQSCHTNGNYHLVYADCYQCHQAEYQQSVNPNHVVANFPHDCGPCHSTSAWRPSTFNHDQQNFRIYTGAHRGRWTVCSDCHQTPSNFADFTCVNCHRQNATDPNHREVTGYSYSSPACYTCHRGV